MSEPSRRTALVACMLALVSTSACGKHQGPGTVEGRKLPDEVVDQREDDERLAAAAAAAKAGSIVPDKTILFGDLHVHTTFSADAFMMSLPVMQGEGAHPVADACDFARYCSALDFWSINDHAEATTPRRWRETKETIRQCNAVAGDPDDPDVVAFLGWEWTQVGRTPDTHYGHKNVIFRETAEDRVPKRVIHSAGFAFQAMRRPLPLFRRLMLPLLDWPNRDYDADLFEFQDEVRAVPECPEGVDTRELPENCLEGAATPAVLFEKLDQWGFDSMVIPHGTTWGIYTPAGTDWAKQIGTAEHDAERQRLVEVFSGHGNSEEYRSWRAVDIAEDGTKTCPEPTRDFEPCCWRAGEIIRGRCQDPDSGECEQRVVDARRNYLRATGTTGRFAIPGATAADWRDCDSCRDCFLPSMNYRPGNSVQYMLAARPVAGGDPLHFGFIASSDNHRGRPGTGYKEYDRLENTEAFGPRDKAWFDRLWPFPGEAPAAESVEVDAQRLQTVQAFQLLDWERQASFFLTGGLAAVHAEGRSRDEIWQALERREVYGTSGPRILLWFDLVGADGTVSPMGSRVATGEAPKFRVRAVGSRVQLEGCPEFAQDGLSPERLRRLCRGECYNPGDERKNIARIEVVRIRRQKNASEPIERLIDDPWRVFPCSPDPAGCTVEFDDPSFATLARDATYYVRAIETPAEVINADSVRCEYDASGRCVRARPCYGDYRTSREDDCLAPAEPRAWSSPIYLSYNGSR